MRVSGRDAKRFVGKPRMMGPLSQLDTEPAPLPVAPSTQGSVFFIVFFIVFLLFFILIL